MSTCKHGTTAPTATLENLHPSQAGEGRHKCCECAFERGYQLGREQAIAPGGNSACQEGRRADTEMLDALPPSQAGPGRHKCAICAYHEGFQRGRALATAPKSG